MRIGIIILLFSATLTVPARAADVARMQQVIRANVAGDHFMGTVLIAQRGTILLDKGYGAANLEWDIPNTPTTRF
jgi:CubicO group peptidase (beta-lactamase class C family)